MTTTLLRRRLLAVVGLSCAVALAAAPTALAAQPGHAATSAVPAHAAAPPSTISWAVAPSSSKGSDGRTHFNYADIKPGDVIHDYVGITNFSGVPVTFQVYGTDGITTSSGSLGLAPTNQKSRDIGAWLHTEHDSVTVPPQRELNEPFTLTVPADATPGDHVGGVIAALTQHSTNGKVAQENRVGVAVYLRVSGPLHPVLSVESMSISGYHGTPNPFGGGSTTVSYTVRNTGNVRLGGAQTVSVTGPFGIPLASVRPAALEEILPGDSVRVTATVDGIFPAGLLTVRADVTPHEEQGTAHVTVPLVAGSRSVDMVAIPWPQLLLLVVLVAVGLGIGLFLRRRRRTHAAALRAAVERGRREATEQLAAVGGRDGDTAPDSE